MAGLFDEVTDPYTTDQQPPGGMVGEVLRWLYRQGAADPSSFATSRTPEDYYDPSRSFAANVRDPRALQQAMDVAMSVSGAGLATRGRPPVKPPEPPTTGLLAEPAPFSTPPGPSSPTGIGSVSEGGVWTPSAPAIIKPPEGLDYRGINMAARPDVPQFPLDRPPTWVKGLPDLWRSIDTPQTWERYQAAAAKGLPEGQPGGREWYNTQPLLRAFMEINPSTGAQDFRRYIDYVGASSPESNVPQNIRTASWLYHADKQGFDLPTLYLNDRGGASMYPPDVKARLYPRDAEGKEIKGAARRALISPAEEAALKEQFGFPTGYGGEGGTSWVRHAANIREGGDFNLMTNPKPPSFVQNLLGNYEPFTIDRHNMRVMTGWTPEGKYLPGFADAPPTQAYGHLEGLQQEYARRLRLHPAQTQAATWLGGETGVKSDLGRPFVGEFEQKLYEAAARARISPQELLRDFVLGNRPL